VDESLIDELYAASTAGVEIDLIVRGICCLRPGVPGLSDRIRVRSIIDRFLEHARVFYFQNDGTPEYLLASADWMPRNLDHRVEIAFPILAPALQAQLRQVLETQLADNVKARVLQQDGSYKRKRPARGEDAELRKLRLFNFLEFLGPGGFATPDDQEALENCQRGYRNVREVGWNDISKGMPRNGPPMNDDEEQMRCFWRQWNQRMGGLA